MSDDNKENSNNNSGSDNTNSGQSDIEKLKAELDKFKTEIRTVSKDRDEAKKLLKEREEAEAVKKGEFEKLANERQTEIEKLSQQVSELTPFKEQLTKIQEERKNELLEQLTDEQKEFAKDLPFELLPAYVKKHKTNIPATDSSRAGGLAYVQDGKKWDDYSDKERIEISEKNPDLYARLRKEKYKN